MLAKVGIIHSYGVLNKTQTGKWRTMLQYKAILKEAKDTFVEMELYYLGSLNFFNTEFYSPKELGLCKAFKPWAMYQDFIHQDQLGTEYLKEGREMGGTQPWLSRAGVKCSVGLWGFGFFLLAECAFKVLETMIIWVIH